ncbi:hypothetical protein NEICINOT_04226 [Neisseria cinerea ATCC 14685]|uniref:Uncharacterized protein n=1 Tax=Neisseria cinerea ATCC 14685 TaxID=546262 RepID=D0W3I6_NEICI|nr:hypothetical protein NEICINOT_04226 [Neisseria cinerea ATCC 14685]
MICLLFNAAAFIPMRVGIYRENKNFSAVMPAKAGIRKLKVTGTYPEQ